MATLPATAAGEVRRILRVPNGDGTDSPAKGYAYLYPNLRPGTPYRASSVEPQLASKTRLVFDGAGQLEDPETGLWAKVLGSDAPGATFPDMQWVLEYHLENVPPTEQPARQFFTVPAGSFRNVDLIADTGPQPNTATVYIDAAPTMAAVDTTDTAVNDLFSSATATRTTTDARYAASTDLATTDTNVTDLTGRVTTLEAASNHTDVRNRFCTVTSTFTTTTFADFTGADATALAMTFTKSRAATKLVINLTGVCELTTGVAQNGHLGVSVAGVDYEVSRARFPAGASNNRRTITGVVEIPGVAAGSVTIKPRFRATAGSSTFGFYADDMVSYSVTETL